MVRPKQDNKSILTVLREQAEELERMSPVLRTRWYVVEHTPARRYHDGYDYTWGRESNQVVSPYFDSESDAETWVDKHEPDEGSTLIIKSQNLREFKYKKWGV